ncbi:hypothetical protein Acr_29g0010810 [Actinidia rufa]|uniref:Uncharacterized protein n=1 Tax=Actinidia rufa TaxID=165716 RepID=A0A7J0HFR0_9ERIC|nr:hypothetical protein Acr_29g0010810 [Actinidia rufa]
MYREDSGGDRDPKCSTSPKGEEEAVLGSGRSDEYSEGGSGELSGDSLGVILGSSLAVRSKDFAESALNQKAVAESAEMEMVRAQNRAIELEGALAEEKVKGKKLAEDADARSKVIAKLEARISELEKSQSLTQGRIIAAFKESDDFLEALAHQYPDIGVDLEDVEMDHEFLAKEEAEAQQRAAEEGAAGAEGVERRRTHSRSHVDGELNAEWARLITALPYVYINGVNLSIRTFSLLSKCCSVFKLHLAINRSAVPFMFSKTNLGGEESEQSLPSWISDHLGAKSYIDETSQSPSFPTTNSPKMDTSSLTKEGNAMSQAELDKLGSTYSFPSRIRLRIPGDGETIYQLAKARVEDEILFCLGDEWEFPSGTTISDNSDSTPRVPRSWGNARLTPRGRRRSLEKIEPGGYFEVSKVLGSRTFNKHFAVGCTALSTSGGDNTTSGDEGEFVTREDSVEYLGVIRRDIGGVIRRAHPAMSARGKAKAEKATKTAKPPTKGVVIREKCTREGNPLIEIGEPDSSRGKEAVRPPPPKRFKSNRGAINAGGRAGEAGTSSPGGDMGSESMSDASVARRLLTGVIPASDKKEVDQLSENELDSTIVRSKSERLLTGVIPTSDRRSRRRHPSYEVPSPHLERQTLSPNPLDRGKTSPTISMGSHQAVSTELARATLRVLVRSPRAKVLPPPRPWARSPFDRLRGPVPRNPSNIDCWLLAPVSYHNKFNKMKKLDLGLRWALTDAGQNKVDERVDPEKLI